MRRTRKLHKYGGVNFRSKYEATCAEELDKLGVQWEYEPDSFEYVLPPSTYTPDFKVYDSSGKPRYIEVKGFYDATARRKMQLVREQHPEVLIDFHFMRDNKVAPRSKLTYRTWAEKHGYTSSVGIEELRRYASGLAKAKVHSSDETTPRSSRRKSTKGSRTTP